MWLPLQVHYMIQLFYYNITGDAFMFLLLKGKVQTMQSIVSEHEQYLDSLRDFNDWLISAKEELQRWSDLSGDSVSIKRKLQKVQVRSSICHTRNTKALIIVIIRLEECL